MPIWYVSNFQHRHLFKPFPNPRIQRWPLQYHPSVCVKECGQLGCISRLEWQFFRESFQNLYVNFTYSLCHKNPIWAGEIMAWDIHKWIMCLWYCSKFWWLRRGIGSLFSNCNYFIKSRIPLIEPYSNQYQIIPFELTFSSKSVIQIWYI